MNFDVFTIAALVDELSDRLDGGRIQDTLELGDDALGFEIYARRSRHYLLISADPQQARLHLVPEKLRRGVETPSPLGLLIRRHLEGARLVAIRQPAWERVVMLEFEGSEGPVSLIVEPMERRGNILLVREGQIMDCIRRVGPSDNRVRLSLPGHAYVPPPPQLNKHAPTQITLELIRAILEADPGKPAWRALSENLLALTFQPTPRHAGAMRIALCPTVRSTQKRLQYTATNNEVEVTYTAPQRIYDLNLRTDVPIENFLIVAPSSDASRRTSIGNGFLMTAGSAERLENVLLIIPRSMRVEEVPAASPR